MKKISFLMGVCICYLSFLSCSSETSGENDLNSLRIIAPNGTIVAQSISDLNKRIFNGEGEITEVNFIDTPKDYPGFAIEISYKKDKMIHKTIYASKIPHYKFDSKSIKISQKAVESSEPGDIIVKCSGAACCYPGGTYDFNTGQMSFFCQCEGNFEQNSSCIMTVQQVIDDKP